MNETTLSSKMPEDIIAAIRSSFKGVPLGEITIHQAEVIDVYGCEHEEQQARLRDTATCWEDIPDSHIQECAYALNHLDAIAWRFYIPAYMIWTLRYSHTSSAIVCDFTIYNLNHGNDKDESYQHSLLRYLMLDEIQSNAVYQFLEYMAADDRRGDSDAAREALDSYWNQFSKVPELSPMQF